MTNIAIIGLGSIHAAIYKEERGKQNSPKTIGVNLVFSHILKKQGVRDRTCEFY
ncbi:MAG: hypothetical protein M3Z01_01515 [Thermoproteota archaeon]|nr:hypothetical protein [Thermoproteota archaeon]